MKNNILCPFINQAEKVEVIEKFDQAEKMRLELIKENKFGSESDVNSHPGAIFTSRLLNSSSTSSYLTTSKQKTTPALSGRHYQMLEIV
ncbi:unnamed protein product [Rhizophagus irregularis]|nr:unnamed protein product [Rhizophagus irregularis]